MLRLLLVLLSLIPAFAAPRQAAPSRTVDVEAERFSFTPSRIELAPGETVEFSLTSADTAHGFKVDGTDIDVEIPKRGQGKAVVRFTAPADGTLRFECSRMCGAGHHFMRGEIVIKPRRTDR